MLDSLLKKIVFFRNHRKEDETPVRPQYHAEADLRRAKDGQRLDKNALQTERERYKDSLS